MKKKTPSEEQRDRCISACSNFEPLTFVTYCYTYNCTVFDRAILLSMAKNREHVRHVFGRKIWKLHYNEEENEKKIKKGEEVYKRIVKYYMEEHSPTIPQILVDIVEKFLNERVVKIKLKSMDCWGQYIST